MSSDDEYRIGQPGDADPLGLHGVIPPIVTGFDGDEELDPDATAVHARFAVERGCHGVFALGTNGEFPLLTPDERVRVVEAIVDEVGDSVPVLAGVGAPSTYETIRNATRAAEAGVDGLVVVTPYYYPLEDAGLVDHYRRVADAVDRPIYAYNIPKRTGNDISLEALDELLAIDAVVGCKDSSGDLGWLGQAIDAHPEGTFIGGSDALLFPSLQLGCSGMVSAVANVFPSVVVELYEAAVEGNIDRARELQSHAYELRTALTQGSNLAGVKAALDLRGFDVGPVRDPLQGFDDDELETLEQTLIGVAEADRVEVEVERSSD